MQMRKNAMCIIVMLLMGALGAMAQQEGARYEKTYDMGEAQLIFDADIEAPTVENAQPLPVYCVDWTVEKLLALFPEARELPVKEVNGYIEIIDSALQTDGTYIASEPNGYMHFGSKQISIDHAMSLYRNAVDGLDTRGEIEGYPFDEALAQLTTLCEQMGVPEFFVEAYSAMDSQALTDSYTNSGRGGEDPSTEPEQPPEGYLVSIRFAFDGLAMIETPSWLNTMKEHKMGSAGIAYVTKDEGVLTFYCAPDTTLYQRAEGVEPGEFKASIPVQQAIDAVVKRFSGVIMDESITIERIAYQYVPVPVKNKEGAFILRPAWCFYPARSRSDYADPISVNALNGKIIK